MLRCVLLIPYVYNAICIRALLADMATWVSVEELALIIPLSFLLELFWCFAFLILLPWGQTSFLYMVVLGYPCQRPLGVWVGGWGGVCLWSALYCPSILWSLAWQCAFFLYGWVNLMLYFAFILKLGSFPFYHWCSWIISYLFFILLFPHWLLFSLI